MNHATSPSRTGLAGGRTLVIVAAAILAAALPVGAHGQLVLDRGTFRLFVDGEEAGAEEFTIQRIGTGDAQVTLARGTVTMNDGRTLVTVLRLESPAMVLNEYAAEVTGTDTRAVRVVRRGDRLRTRTVAPWGEEMREYRARATTVLFDEGVAHHYFLLGRFLDGSGETVRLHAFAPLSEREGTAAGLSVGSETIVIDGERVEATRIGFGSGRGAGTAWFDGSGRLVRVSLPARGFAAERRFEG